MSAPHSKLSAATDDRKARLAKLRSLKRKEPADEISQPAGKDDQPDSDAVKEPVDVARLHISGRNYDPETRGPKLGFEAPPNLNQDKPTLEEQAGEIEAEIQQKRAEEEQQSKGIDLYNLQPKKPNWDLKRDLDKKLEILNVRTDNAIAKIVRERITNSKQKSQASGGTKNGGVDADGLDGVTLVEGVKVREQEEAEERQREREEAELEE